MFLKNTNINININCFLNTAYKAGRLFLFHYTKKSDHHSDPTSLRPVYVEMAGQERTLSVLLQQAFRIKDDMASSLHATQGSVLMEASARKLLENHVQTITHIVKQLSKDIQVSGI